MTAYGFLKLYLELNIAIAFCYVLFRFCYRWAPKTIKAQSLARVAQVVLLVSMVGPLLFKMPPSHRLQKFNVKTIEQLSEWGKATGTSVVSKKGRDFGPAPEEYRSPFHFNFWFLSASYLGVALLLGWGFITAVFLRNLARIILITRRSVILKKIGRVSIGISPNISIPFSYRGLYRAWVVIPERLVDDEKNLMIAIHHEIQHHRQRDTGWALFAEGLVCFFFMNPAIYGWRKVINEFQEIACDEVLIGHKNLSPGDYGRCLLKVAEAALKNRRAYVGTACMATDCRNKRHFKSFLKRRIEMLTEHRRSKVGWGASLLLGTIVSIVTVTMAFGSQLILADKFDDRITLGVLNFDSGIQSITSQLLEEEMEKQGALSGFVVVAEPSTGRILAVANFQRENQPPYHLRQRGVWALSHLIEPASISKGLVVAAALDQGVTTPDERLNCENGTFPFGGHTYKDWKPFNTVTTTEAIAYSSNICGVKLGQKLGARNLRSILENFGIGPNGSTRNFPQSRAGRMPSFDEVTEEEFIGITATGYSGFNSGFQISPLEMVMAYSAIANGGNLMEPLQASSPATGGRVVRRVLRPEAAQRAKEILHQAVLIGTGKNAKSTFYSTAGKTSSGFRRGHDDHDKLGGDTNTAGFIGFAPLANPRLTVYVAISDPADAQVHGATRAAPLFKRVTEQVLQYLKVAPDLAGK